MEHPGSHCLGREHGTEEASIASLAPVTVRRAQIAEKQAGNRGALLGSGAKTGLSGQPGRLLIPPGCLDSCERS